MYHVILINKLPTVNCSTVGAGHYLTISLEVSGIVAKAHNHKIDMLGQLIFLLATRWVLQLPVLLLVRV